MNGDKAGPIYLEAITAALTDEASRKSSIETRGAGIISTSGTLVTLLFGLAALITKQSDYQLPSSVIPLLVVALALFAIAIVVAFASFVPRSGYEAMSTADLRTHVTSNWDQTAEAAKKGISTNRLDALETARRKNGQKAFCLTTSILVQMIAVGVVGLAVASILLNALPR
jgi:hypothetical protein